MRVQKATDDQVVAAYQRGGSMRAAGQMLGMCAQSVHERLTRLGASKHVNVFSDADRTRLLAEYNDAIASGRLQHLAASMGRTRQFICRQARALGLTDLARPKSESSVAKRRGKTIWATRPHPRGMAGKRHGVEAKARMGVGQRLAWSTAKTFGISHMSNDNRQRRSDAMFRRHQSGVLGAGFSRSKAGYRRGFEGIYFRSSWEANYARFLNLMVRYKIVESWEFEPETFWFLAIKRGTRSYLPDFRVYYKNESSPVYVEVKGWMDPKSVTKIKRFKKYYPQHRLEVVDAKAYRKLASQFGGSIPGWE